MDHLHLILFSPSVTLDQCSSGGFTRISLHTFLVINTRIDFFHFYCNFSWTIFISGQAEMTIPHSGEFIVTPTKNMIN